MSVLSSTELDGRTAGVGKSAVVKGLIGIALLRIPNPSASSWIATAKSYQLALQTDLKDDTYDAIILAVSHKAFAELGVDSIRKLGKQNNILYDIKSLFPKDKVDGRL